MRADYNVLPFQMSLWLNRAKLSGNVVIVSIDDKTVDSYTRGTAPAGALYPALFRKLKEDKAAIVGLAAVLPRDLGLTDPVLSKLLGRSQPGALDVDDGVLAGLQHDLADAIEEQGSTYLGWTSEGWALAPPDYSSPDPLASGTDRHEADSSPHYGPIGPAKVEGDPGDYGFGRGNDVAHSFGMGNIYPARYEGPPRLLDRAARGTAYLDIETGKASGVTQYVAPALKIAGHYYAPFSIAIASDYLHQAPIAIAFVDWTAAVSIGRTVIPSGWFLYCRPHDAFAHYPAIDVVNGKTPIQDLAGKIVLVGFETRSSPKLQALSGKHYLVELQANAIEDILTKDFTHVFTNDAIVFAVAIPIGLGITLFLAYFASSMSDRRLIVWSIIAVAAVFFTYYGSVVFVLRTYRVYCTWFMPMGFCVLAQTVAFSALLRRRRRIRARMRTAFECYLDPKILESVFSDSKSLELGGESREITVMFADLSGFTAASTKMTPDALTSKVNRYFNYIVQPVDSTGGYVERFLGDAVLGMWGAPLTSEDHAVKAVRAAMAIVDGVRRAREEDEARGEPGFTIKVGINSGIAVVGNVGSENRFSYTAMGEDVNLAARLESVPPLYGCLIVAGEHTARLAEKAYLMRELDWLLVKGADKPMAVYQPLVELDSATAAQNEIVARFAQALEHYRARRFADACSIWDELAAEYEPHPSPSSVMAARSRQLISNPPDNSWNAINVLVNK